jgi:hypothetical protein
LSKLKSVPHRKVQPYDGTTEQETFGIPEANPRQTSYYYTRYISISSLSQSGMAHGHLLGYNSRAMHETHQRCIDKDESGERTKQRREASSARTNMQLATEHKNALIIPGYKGAKLQMHVANYYNLEDKKQGNIPIMLLFFEPALHQSKQSNNHCYRMKMYLSKVDLKK